jgi:hypothetical protein
VVALALGLITTVGVAWVFASLPRRFVSRGLRSQESMRAVKSPQGRLGFIIVTRMSWGGGWTSYEASAVMFQDLNINYREIVSHPDTLLPASMRAMLMPWLDGQAAWPPSGQGESRSLIVCGWPLPALACAAAYAPRNALQLTIIWGWPLPPRLASYLPGADFSGSGTTLLPTHPLYRGLILDTLLYGAAWFPFLATPGAFRRTLRRRRGHCPACGYDRLGEFATPCPECGHQPRVARTPGP